MVQLKCKCFQKEKKMLHELNAVFYLLTEFRFFRTPCIVCPAYTLRYMLKCSLSKLVEKLLALSVMNSIIASVYMITNPIVIEILHSQDTLSWRHR